MGQVPARWTMAARAAAQRCPPSGGAPPGLSVAASPSLRRPVRAPANGVSVASVALHPHSLELIEFPRVARAIAERATSPRAAAALANASPIGNAARRAQACERLSEAIRRQREPEAWCFAVPSSLADVLSGDARDALDAEAFAGVSHWPHGGARTRAAWTEGASEDLAERFPRLSALAPRLPELEALRERLARTLDQDGRVRDGASSALASARRGIME